MIIYEVNLTVDRDIADDYAAWLTGHIGEMLALPGFESAEWLVDRHYDAGEGADPRWSVQYRLGCHDDFVRYERDHAERMRAEGIERFGDRFSATRRILEAREAFAPKP